MSNLFLSLTKSLSRHGYSYSYHVEASNTLAMLHHRGGTVIFRVVINERNKTIDLYNKYAALVPEFSFKYN